MTSISAEIFKLSGVAFCLAPPIGGLLVCPIIAQDGSFVVRQSRHGGNANPFALTVVSRGLVYNLLIRLKPNRKYALGSEKPDEHVCLEIYQLHDKKTNKLWDTERRCAVG